MRITRSEQFVDQYEDANGVTLLYDSGNLIGADIVADNKDEAIRMLAASLFLTVDQLAVEQNKLNEHLRVQLEKQLPKQIKG